MSNKKNHPQVTFQFSSDKALRSMECTFQHTEHSYLRACQRGFSQKRIETVLLYGKSVCKQGLIYYILGENNVPDILSRQKEQLKNSVVIISGVSNHIITCYRSVNPFKYIRHKSEKLYKKHNHAA